MKTLCFFLTVLCSVIKMMDGLGPNLYFSACHMFTACSCEFTNKYQYSPKYLTTDFMNLKNRMFLLINYRL
jgi:hypothetical protein